MGRVEIEVLTWNKRGRQQSTIFWRNVGNPTAHKDLKGHKNLWLTKFSHLMMWHTHAHLVKHPPSFLSFHNTLCLFFLSFFLCIFLISLINISHFTLSPKQHQQQQQKTPTAETSSTVF